jgi:hypothetical protein
VEHSQLTLLRANPIGSRKRQRGLKINRERKEAELIKTDERLPTRRLCCSFNVLLGKLTLQLTREIPELKENTLDFYQKEI